MDIKRLEEVVTDRYYAWDRSSFTVADITCPLRVGDLDQCIAAFKNDYVEKGFGLGLMDLHEITHSPTQQRELYLAIAGILGILLPQNSADEKVVEVIDRGRTLEEGGRYHQTKQGGSLHTDCPQWLGRPEYLGLLCVRQAIHGGEGKFVSAYSLHNNILREHPRLLPTLYEPFHFDKRGDVKPGESPTTLAPVFTYDGRELTFRYLRDYIDGGHERVGLPLTPIQQDALHAVDEQLENKDLVVALKLQPGQILFNNNLRTVHGRTGYEDTKDSALKRLLLRTWIRKGDGYGNQR